MPLSVCFSFEVAKFVIRLILKLSDSSSVLAEAPPHDHLLPEAPPLSVGCMYSHTPCPLIGCLSISNFFNFTASSVTL